ncbi:MAG: hypothetical protein RLZ98_1919 [Pseudomonadota bacterium]|jgi:threonine dehydrogenase-like Zn-dependent dehydrogenase
MVNDRRRCVDGHMARRPMARIRQASKHDRHCFPGARLVSDRKIDVDSLFTHRFKLEQADEAYRLLDQQKTGKGVFLPA